MIIKSSISELSIRKVIIDRLKQLAGKNYIYILDSPFFFFYILSYRKTCNLSRRWCWGKNSCTVRNCTRARYRANGRSEINLQGKGRRIHPWLDGQNATYNLARWNTAVKSLHCNFMVNLLRAFFPPSPLPSLLFPLCFTAPRETLHRHRSSFPLFLISNPVRSLLFLNAVAQNHGYAIYGFVLSSKSEDARRKRLRNFRLILTFQRENVSIGVPDDRKLLTTNKLENVQDAREDED